jgi:hypothetical protein
MSSELAVVASAFLVFWMAPALLSAVDAYRRRAASAAAGRMQALPDSSVTSGPALEEPPPAGLVEPQAHAALDAAITTEGSLQAPEELAETRPSETEGGADDEWEAVPPDDSGVAAGKAGHKLRLGELRHAHLEHWPPDTVRRDPERSRAWLEAERYAHQVGSRLDAAEFVSPFPAHACCFAGGEAGDSGWRLRFLLFTELWPEQEGQAEAAVVFAVSADETEVRSQVSLRRR